MLRTIKEIRVSDTLPQLHQDITESSSVWSATATASVECIYTTVNSCTQCNLHINNINEMYLESNIT